MNPRGSASFVLLLPVAAMVLMLLFMPGLARAQNLQVDLSSTSALCGGEQCFNTAGLFNTGVQFLGTNGMDNGNNCTPTAPYTNCPDAYSANQLGLSTSTPPTLTPPSLNVPFNFGTVNAASCGPSTSVPCTLNVVNYTPAPGVAITIPVASPQNGIFSSVIILGTAVNGGHKGSVTLSYATGSPTVFTQTLSDWCGFGGNQYESIAVGGFNRINSDGTLNGASCNLYAYTYPVDFTRPLTGITLTDLDGSGAMFALAITLKPPTYTIAGGTASPSSVTVGSTSTATVTVNPQTGYAANGPETIQLSCAISPTITSSAAATAPTCSLSPTSVQVTATETSPPTATLTFTSAKPASAALQLPRTFFYAFWLPIPGLALIRARFRSRTSRRKHLLGWLLLGLLLTGLIAAPGCVSYTHLGNVGTPPGQYTVSVTGVDSNGLSQASNPSGTTNTVTVTVAEN
ncbi:MAG TPA: hypothetical protein VNX26_09735 [Candidatus Acidoferrum sp.]|nr:hypothetical protein [Candidatus Acidoferrum sp.]